MSTDTQALRALFHGLERAYGVFTLTPALAAAADTDKREGKARTVRGPVTEGLYEQHLKGTQGLGIVPIDDQGMSHFGAIDIDRYPLDIPALEAACAVLQLPLLPTRTKSGGAHLYCFTAGPVPAKLLRARLQEWSAALGYPNAEVFPKQNALASQEDTGNWINLPYFEWDSTRGTVRYGVFNGARLTLEQYVARAEQLRVNEQQLRTMGVDDGGAFQDGPPCLQAMARVGFPQGVRNNSLFAIAVYLRKAYPDEWQDKLRLYNAQHIKPPLGEAEVKAVIKSAARKSYNYNCDEPPCRDRCNRSVCRTRMYGVNDGKAGKDEWGVAIDSDSQMVLTDPPYWMLTINGTRMKLFSDDLLQQRLFQKACVERIRLMPPTLDAETWRQVVNNILTNSEQIEAAADSGAAGEAAYHLRQFCTVFPQAERREEIMTGKPYTEDRETLFRAADFKKYLESQHYRSLTGARLYAALKELCGLHYRSVSVGDRNVHVWVVPEFDRNVIPMPPRKQPEGM